MARVSVAKVEAIITTERDVNLFINISNRMLTDLLTGKGLSADRLEDIELYFTAHLIELVDRGGGILEEKTGQSSVKYNALQGAKGIGLTHFGQTAAALDTTNTLSELGSIKGRFTMLGI